ncbi:MAG: hypothetical protein WAS73_12305 [Defluviicoccus sp.]
MIRDAFLAALRAAGGRRRAGPTLLTRIGTELGAEDPRRFNYALALWSGLLLAACIVGGLILDRLHRLPAPPLTATNCIDEKLKFLFAADLEDVRLVAVGSSSTWRNLAFDDLARADPESRPINAAPCYLYMNQTAYFTGFLLNDMPRVATVVSLVTPRDFEDCRSEDTMFFDASTARDYVFAKNVPWHLYVTNLRPTAFAQDVIRLRRMRLDSSHPATLKMDTYGSSPMQVGIGWMPEPRFDDRCFAALAELEATAAGHGARLVVATVPTMPRWRQRFDPDGAIGARFRLRLRTALREPTSLLIDGDEFAVTDDDFADPVHLLRDNVAEFSRFITGRMVDPRTTAAGRI